MSMDNCQINESKGISIDTEDVKFYETPIGEHNAYVSVKDDRLVVMITLDKTLLTLSGKIDESTAIKIMGSVKLKINLKNSKNFVTKPPLNSFTKYKVNLREV